MSQTQLSTPSGIRGKFTCFKELLCRLLPNKNYETYCASSFTLVAQLVLVVDISISPFHDFLGSLSVIMKMCELSYIKHTHRKKKQITEKEPKKS